MRLKVKSILLYVLTLVLFVSCSNGTTPEKTVKSFIGKLISSETYKNIEDDNLEQFMKAWTTNFEEYLTKNGIDSLVINRTPTRYYDVITLDNLKKVSDIKIKKTKETEKDDYINMEYEVSYKLEFDNSTVDMKDYMAFKVINDNKYVIDKVIISDKSSSIYKKYAELVKE